MAPFSNIEEPTVVFFDGEFDDCSSSAATSVTSLRSSLRSADNSSSSSSSNRRSCTVTFSEGLTVFPVLHIHDFSLAEKRECWLNAEDMRIIRQDWKEVVEVLEMYGNSQMETDESTEDSGFCVRGLEGKTYVGKRRRQEARALAMEVVLDAQLYQASPDPFMIASEYADQVFPLHVEAFERGQKDAQAVGKESVEDQPTKFDFQAPRAKFYASLTNVNDKENGEEDATVSIYEKHSSSSNKELLKGPSFSLRNSLNCFLPTAPKRHGRRSLRRSKAPRYL